MKFILLVEDEGYQIRYWNEMTSEIGPTIAESWDKNELYKKLSIKQFHIDKRIFNEAIKEIELEDRPFVVLKSNETSGDSIDLFINDTFTIDHDNK